MSRIHETPITIQTSLGPKQITGTLFDFVIGEKKYRFAIHKGVTGLAITHLASGVFVTGITDALRQACLGNLKQSAKRSLQIFVDEYGADRVSKKLDSLKELRPNHVTT